MRDYKFGTRIYNLRKGKNLSQEELGNLIGVSNKAVSKWETGESKPAVSQLMKLSKVFDVSIDDIIDCEETREKQITKIVITGGPCAGKSTALSWIQAEYTKKGYAVIFVPESATELILAGISSVSLNSDMEFQTALLKNQLTKEKLFEEVARKMANNKVLIVCDRGAMDGKAYIKNHEYEQMLKYLGLNEVELRDNYDAVFHLVTTAIGAREYYTLENNKARYESVEEAVLSDKKTLQAWTGHPHLRVIDNSTEFEGKMIKLLKEISAFLGEEQPYEIERKFLIKYPDLNKLNEFAHKKVEIIQTYLESSPDQELRLRQRGDGKSFVYTKTRKWKVNDLKRVEFESRISKEEYLSLLMDADTDIHQIRKTRYCVVYNNQYIEIDIYPFSKDKAILEIELNEESQDCNLPSFIEAVKEVTDDDKYKNINLAMSRTLD
ncbi:MAG: AAA family ATPase [Clostridia bacterium]|nr:AAA family ATPase [Clostridia bacterium]